MNPLYGWTYGKQPWDKDTAAPASPPPLGPVTTPGTNPGATPGVPAYTGGMQPYNITKANANITAGLNGELPQDVIDQIRTQAAEFGVSSGLSGSDFSGYQGLRNLGLTSLQRQDEATKMTLPFMMTPADVDRRTSLASEAAARNRAALFQDRAMHDQEVQQGILRAQKQQQAASDYWERTRSGGAGSGGTPASLAPTGTGYGGSYGPPPAHSVANDIISRNLPGLGDLLGGYGGGGGSDPHGTGSYAPLQVGFEDNGDWTADNDWVME